MKMYLAGAWQERPECIEVRNPFSGEVIDTVPKATPADVTTAVDHAVTGAEQMRKLSGFERSQLLRKTVALMHQRAEELARTITQEEGKPIKEGRSEVARAIETMDLSADEAKRLSGEVLPLDGAPGGANKLGFTLRVPCGIVAAITPFNFPLNLVCHKVGPALAAGNAVILKPASDTPLVALKLVEILLAAGFPPLGIQCLTGSGAELGLALCHDPRIRKMSFTGSRDVGDKLIRAAGIKRVTLELGSNAPVLVLPDADLDRVAESLSVSGYANAGQVCISAQRVLAVQSVYDELLAKLKPRVEALTTGDPLHETTQLGPLVREQEAVRVHDWIGEAVRGGARLVTGGDRSGSVVQPTIVADVAAGMRISCEELFGPAVACTSVANVDEAIRLASDTPYGLTAAIFTRDLQAALRFARVVPAGNLHINGGPAWRCDLMPYGGLKESGLGREGPRYAIEEMTELKTVVVHLE